MWNLLQKILTLLIFIPALAMADGAVSGGGGGVTNPNPADPEWVIMAAHLYGGKVIESWLNKEKINFEDLSLLEQQQSKFYKVFRHPNNVFDLLKKVKVEVKMSAPCLDQAGLAHDGSVSASRPNTICLSAFSMAPKLNQYNVNEETMALLVHELAHVLGMSENEAISLQLDALSAFHKADIMDYVINLGLWSRLEYTDFQWLTWQLDLMINRPARLESEDLSNWMREYSAFFYEVITHSEELSALSHEQGRFQLPYGLKVASLYNQICMDDPEVSPNLRQNCTATINQAFTGATQITAKEYSERTNILDGYVYGPEYDQVLLKRVSTAQEIKEELVEVLRFLKNIQREFITLHKAQLQLSRIP